jgi:cytochrome c5
LEVNDENDKIRVRNFSFTHSPVISTLNGEEPMSRFVSTALVGAALLVSSNVFAAAKYDAKAGASVYNASCATCHKTGMMGAPKVGDKAAWASYIKEGMDVMVSKSIKGFKGAKGQMPAKGGNAKLTDQQVGDAVAYMVSLSK